MNQQLSLISNEETVNQANTLIETPQDLTLQEKRIIWVLASFINESDTNFRRQSIKVEELAKLIGIKSKNFYKIVQDTIDGLIGKTVTINKENKRTVLSWLSSATYHKGQGIVELEFSEMLRPYLLQLNQQLLSDNTSFKLGNVLSLKSKYSGRMYELLKQYEATGESRYYSIEEFRDILHVPNDVHQLYSKLKAKVIMQAKKDLENKTDIMFELKEYKESRKVVGVSFVVSPNFSKIVSEADQLPTVK
ncbi:replication initiation protein [Shouchella sp. 1P09AA]|uniref:replication initiation protein n=1 Tax=unclassified Shouchella TaxID=2893065 RepID=UPI0039A1FBDC